MDNLTKIVLGVALIALVLSSASLAYVMQVQTQITEMSGKIENLNKAVSDLSAQTKEEELFPGEAAMYAAAKQEGQLVLASAEDVEYIINLLKGFQQRYPAIEATYWVATGSQIRAKVQVEYEAKMSTLDSLRGATVTNSMRSMLPGVYMKYETVQKDQLLVHDSEIPVATLIIRVLAYNTNLLKPENAPKSWEDLADPKYKGMILLDDPLRGGPGTDVLASLKAQWNDDSRWTAYNKALRENAASIQRNTEVEMQMLMAGDYPIAFPTLLSDTWESKKLGAPIETVNTATAFAAPYFVAVFNYAPHPNTAKLFSEWCLSVQGQTIFDSQGSTSNRKGFVGKSTVAALMSSDTPVYMVPTGYLATSTDFVKQYMEPLWK